MTRFLFASPNAAAIQASPPGSHTVISFGGMALHLLPERALWSPIERMLFVADLHVGKEASFRAAGLPVPDVFRRDLTRLSVLIDSLRPVHLFILGDLLHDRSAHSPEVAGVFSSWRRKHSELQITLVRGNHDRIAGDPPADWQITCVGEPASCNNLQLRHLPQFNDHCFTLAGHLHPKHRLCHGPDQLRLPCFLIRRSTLVLPAFADFIDHAEIAREPQDSIFLVTGREVIKL